MTDSRTIEGDRTLPAAAGAVHRESLEPERHVTQRVRQRSAQRIALAGLAVFSAIILAITLWPHPVDQGREGTVERVLGVLHAVGVPAWFGYGELEFSANIIMFVPLGFFVMLALPRRLRWLAFIVPPLASGAVEVTQLIFLEHRFATLLDVLANSIGGWLGAGVASWAVRK